MYYGIVAYDINYGIGKNNALPWHYPEDMKFFKEKTLDHTIVMGSKTFDSIGKILTGRKNIIFSRNKDKYKKYNLNCNFSVFDDAIKFFDENISSTNKIYIIGGGIIFNISKDYMDVIYVTRINKNYKCDVFFNKEILQNFKVIENKKSSDLEFLTYVRNNR